MPDTSFNSLFLAQSYQDSWDDFQSSLTSASFPVWDYVVLTASNDRQAEGFEAQLEERRCSGLLPARTTFLVVPDRGGRRIGSGGATLGVLKAIADHRGKPDFNSLRTLVIHSGGDSRRVPQYSALGKLFSPVPHTLPDGRPSTLFDEFMAATAPVPARIREGMLLLSGDVLLLFNPLLIDFSGRGAAAISFKEDAETGCHHGVFLRGADDSIARFLHKQPIAKLRELGAVNERGQVDIDTGAVIFSTEMLDALYGLVSPDGAYDRLVNDMVRLSLYGDFLYPLATESTLEDFQREAPEGSFCPELTEARKQVWAALRPFRLKLLRLAPAKFIHFGTTGEILGLMTRGVAGYKDLGWSPRVASSVVGKVAGYASVLSEQASIGDGCYLETSYVHRGSTVGSGVLLSHIDIHGETIPDNVVLHGLKQRGGMFVARIYGVGDNPKAAFPCPFLGGTLEQFMQDAEVPAEELWETGEERTLWNARLYPECETIQEAVAAALNLHALIHGGGDLAAWRGAVRKSLRSGFGDADPQAILCWGRRMRELVRMDGLFKAMKSGAPARECAGMAGSGALSKIQSQWLERKLQGLDFGDRMRLHYYCGAALGGAEGEKQVGECFRTIQQGILESALESLEYDGRRRIVKEQHTVSLPLRVNWGGGWSDTPPYCLEHGGTVLNAAILLGGRRPVEVSLERTDRLEVVFDSRDMDIHGEFADIAPLQRTGDPCDPFALQKAALLACGVIPRTGGNLTEILKHLGGGSKMRSEVTGVPKGSGLGTSSILSVACVKALLEFTGASCDEDELYSRVLCMEQIMSTGGGWQDQVGGVTDGVKYTTSMPGLPQRLKVVHVELPPETTEELGRRFALIYTGQRRLARNLLRDVVGRYVGGEPDSLYALDEIQRVAALMRFKLERGHVDDFAVLMDRHWELSRKIDAGSANTLIDQIFESVDDLLDGRMVCGAGGGGFLQVVLKKGVSKEQLHMRLKDVFGDSAIDVWDCQLAWEHH